MRWAYCSASLRALAVFTGQGKCWWMQRCRQGGVRWNWWHLCTEEQNVTISYCFSRQAVEKLLVKMAPTDVWIVLGRGLLVMPGWWMWGLCINAQSISHGSGQLEPAVLSGEQISLEDRKHCSWSAVLGWTAAYTFFFPLICILGLTGELSLEREEKGRNGKDGEVRGEEVGIAEELSLGQCLLSLQVILSEVLFRGLPGLFVPFLTTIS